ncbi:hypothetical protein [Nocardiopsis prasina]|uniref:hypothetical protein n=1 Tax=Nocardiopsis prasina TaxID=2015 RepID=UPI000344A8E5|nr:hypothetical protein [Nocardiopsis prasina]
MTPEPAEPEAGEWFRRYFAPEELDRLEQFPVRIPTGHEFGLLGLLGAWHTHVRRLRADLTLADGDPSACGVHDLVTALVLRDFVDRGIATLGTELTRSVDSALADLDERFRSLTEEDGVGLLALAEPEAEGRTDEKWWWRRIPLSGPARRELDSAAAREQDGRVPGPTPPSSVHRTVPGDSAGRGP